MRVLLKPRKLLVCQTATGHPVRIVWLSKHDAKAKVVSLRTGLPFMTTQTDLYVVE